jgi:hypothetical protein
MKRNYPLAGLLLLVTLLITSALSAQQFWPKNGFFVRKGYKYTPGKIFIDTVAVIDPETGMEVFEAREDPGYPISINEQRVYDIDEVSTPVQVEGVEMSLDDYFLEQLKPLIIASKFNEYAASLRFYLKSIIIDEKGRVVFYDYLGLKGITAANREKRLTPREFPEKLNKLLSDLPPLKPATVDGKNVMAYAGVDLHHYKIERYLEGLLISYDPAVYGEY